MMGFATNTMTFKCYSQYKIPIQMAAVCYKFLIQEFFDDCHKASVSVVFVGIGTGSSSNP